MDLVVSSELLLKESEDGICCPPLDLLLPSTSAGAAGLLPRTVTEIFGESSSGKTQLCLTLAVSVFKHGRRTLYVHTNGHFPSRRLCEIADRQLSGNAASEVLPSVYVIECSSLSALLRALELLECKLQEEAGKIGLVIVDSFATFFRGEEESIQLRRQIISAGKLLSRVAIQFGIPVVLTNHVREYSDNQGMNRMEAVLGPSWTHYPTVRIHVMKDNERRLAHLVKSPFHWERQVAFVIQLDVDDFAASVPLGEPNARFRLTGKAGRANLRVELLSAGVVHEVPVTVVPLKNWSLAARPNLPEPKTMKANKSGELRLDTNADQAKVTVFLSDLEMENLGDAEEGEGAMSGPTTCATAQSRRNGAVVTSSPLMSLFLGESPHLQLAIPEKSDDKRRSTSSSSQASPSSSSQSKSVDDPSLYAVCQLCDNKIRSTRQSNLTNHVRRHATRKQFQCTRCSYQHNEISKVRLHLQSNHKDTTSQPLDNLSPELQSQWEALMAQCFPGFQTTTKSEEVKSSSKIALLDCLECGISVKLTCLANHLEEKHKEECVPYACDECGFESGSQWKVRLHIAVEHRENAADIAVKTLTAGTRSQLFYKKFFPGFDNGNEEKEEQRLLDLFIQSPYVSDKKGEKKNEKRVEKFSEKPVVAAKKEKFEKPAQENTIRCEICDKIMPQPHRGGLSSLMAHAKRHYSVKQWQCIHCDYASSDAAHVRSHMSLKHNCEDKPRDNGSEEMQRAWLEVTRQAFPSLSSLIDAFKFKTQTQASKQTEEEDEFKQE